MQVRITCITKDNGNHENPHLAATGYGWLNELNNQTGWLSRSEMVSWMEKGNKTYVKDNQQRLIYCYVRTSSLGTKFLQTYSDGTPTDNLLKLKECLR